MASFLDGLRKRGYSSVSNKPEYEVSFDSPDDVLFDLDEFRSKFFNRKSGRYDRIDNQTSLDRSDEFDSGDYDQASDGIDQTSDSISPETYVENTSGVLEETFGSGSSIVSGLVSSITHEPLVTGATVAVAGGIAGVVGHVIHEIVQNHSHHGGITLPHSEFIGPGNIVPVSAAKTPEDQVAKEHDLEYKKIQESKSHDHQEHLSRVFRADLSAIEKFIRVFYETGSLNSLLGAGGLFAKHQVEKHIAGDVLYPKCKYKNSGSYIVYRWF